MPLVKNRTYSPKEALDIDGKVPVKLGKGRMSAAAIARIHELVNEGYSIKGYAAAPTSKSTDKAIAAPVVQRVAPVNVKTVAEFVIFWPLEEFKAVGADKRVWSMKECCNTCRVSLVQCHCGNPTILGDIPVSIVRL